MNSTLAPWQLVSVALLFALIALWSGWAVLAAIQGHRRRREYRLTRSHALPRRHPSTPSTTS